MRTAFLEIRGAKQVTFICNFSMCITENDRTVTRSLFISCIAYMYIYVFLISIAHFGALYRRISNAQQCCVFVFSLVFISMHVSRTLFGALEWGRCSDGYSNAPQFYVFVFLYLYL